MGVREPHWWSKALQHRVKVSDVHFNIVFYKLRIEALGRFMSLFCTKVIIKIVRYQYKVFTFVGCFPVILFFSIKTWSM